MHLLLVSGAMGPKCRNTETSPFEIAVRMAAATELQEALEWLVKHPHTHGCNQARQERIRDRLTELGL